MASELVLIDNPRRKRSRRRKAARTTRARATRRRRRNPGFVMNARRRSGRRRRRRNPGFNLGGFKLPKLMGLDLGQAASVIGGMAGTNFLTNMAAGFIPVPQLQTGAGRIALKTGVVIGGLMVLNAMLGAKGRPITAALGAGGAASILGDVYTQFLQPAAPWLPSLSDYEATDQSLRGYEMLPGGMSGYRELPSGLSYASPYQPAY